MTSSQTGKPVLPPFSLGFLVHLQSRLPVQDMLMRLAPTGRYVPAASTLRGKSLLHGFEIREKPESWDELIAVTAVQQAYSRDEVNHSRHQKKLIHLHAPAPAAEAAAQNVIPSQLFLARDVMDTLLMLCATIEPSFFNITTSGAVLTAHQLLRFARGNPNTALIEAFVAIKRDDDGSMYTCGMHALGYADAKLAGPVVSTEMSVKLLLEFLECTLVNNLLPETTDLSFGSASAQYEFCASPGVFPRRHLNTPEFNDNGMWTLSPTRALG